MAKLSLAGFMKTIELQLVRLSYCTCVKLPTFAYFVACKLTWCSLRRGYTGNWWWHQQIHQSFSFWDRYCVEGGCYCSILHVYVVCVCLCVCVCVSQMGKSSILCFIVDANADCYNHHSSINHFLEKVCCYYDRFMK